MASKNFDRVIAHVKGILRDDGYIKKERIENQKGYRYRNIMYVPNPDGVYRAICRISSDNIRELQLRNIIQEVEKGKYMVVDTSDLIPKQIRFEHKGYILDQNIYNWHYIIMDAETAQIVKHSQCTEQLSEAEAIERIEAFLLFKEKIDDEKFEEILRTAIHNQIGDYDKRILDPEAEKTIADLREKLRLKNIDLETGTKLKPGDPANCEGNGTSVNFDGDLIECCCDECDFFLQCFPDAAEDLEAADPRFLKKIDTDIEDAK